VETTVDVGGWEHECCGPALERDQVVELRCVELPADDRHPARLVETHHDNDPDATLTTVRGRVVELSIRHADGSVEPIERLPSGRALRGFDEHDDGELRRPWTDEPVSPDTDAFVVVIAG
jgi:hypothetical protein